MFRFGDPGGRIYQNVGTSGANILAHWTAFTTGGSITLWSVSPTNGRLGGSSLRETASSGSNVPALSKTLDSQATWGIAFGFRTATIPTLGPLSFCGFTDGGFAQINLAINTDGTIAVTRAGTVLGTSSASLSANTYAHLELKVTIHPSAGAVELRRNGVAIIGPLTGLNTRATANSSANQVFIGYASGNSAAVTFDYDDIIVYDGQTTDALGNADITGPIGDCRLAVIPPSGAGAVTQFTALGTSPNYNCLIDANGPDGDSTCVQSGTVGQTDTYVTGGLPAYATVVKAVALVEYARKTDAGVRTLSPVIRSGGGNSVHPTANALGTNYQYFFNNWGQNPNNGSPTAWTQAGVNAIEIGQQVSG